MVDCGWTGAILSKTNYLNLSKATYNLQATVFLYFKVKLDRNAQLP